MQILGGGGVDTGGGASDRYRLYLIISVILCVNQTGSVFYDSQLHSIGTSHIQEPLFRHSLFECKISTADIKAEKLK